MAGKCGLSTVPPTCVPLVLARFRGVLSGIVGASWLGAVGAVIWALAAGCLDSAGSGSSYRRSITSSSSEDSSEMTP